MKNQISEQGNSFEPVTRPNRKGAEGGRSCPPLQVSAHLRRRARWSSLQAVTLAAMSLPACLLLVLSSQGQLGEANSGSSAAPLNADAAALLAASNALQATSIVILTNELDEAGRQWAPLVW